MIAIHQKQAKKTCAGLPCSFGNKPFYQQELPCDVDAIAELRVKEENFTAVQEEKPTERKFLSVKEFGLLDREESIDELYDLLSATFDQLSGLTEIMRKEHPM
ncbi:hypothetical protein K7432_012923 [Basidiobolus ranarum]|uniref:Uncharacterized protein n=1 Tax=Basidiobolus ranarum TaxID=34480 RepID=A0ABR2WK20_9FUNG